LGGATGPVGGRAPDHPRGGVGTVGLGDHAAAQGLAQDRDPGGFELSGKVVDLTEEHLQLGVAHRVHRLTQIGQRGAGLGHRGPCPRDPQSP